MAIDIGKLEQLRFAESRRRRNRIRGLPQLRSGRLGRVEFNRELARQRAGLTSLAEFEEFAKIDPRLRTARPETLGGGGFGGEVPSFSFRGGRLAKPQFEAATFLEQQELITEFKRQEEAATAATEKQRQDVIGGFERLKATAGEQLAGFGTQARADIRETFRRGEARGQSALVRSGLASTTIAPTVSIRSAAEEADATRRLNENLRRENLGLLTGIETQKLSAIERQEISGPSQSLFIQLQERLGNIGA